jgi:acylphosphatase
VQTLWARELTFEDVDGSLASLSTAGGFRKHIRATALGCGLTGSVRRLNGRNVGVQLEGSEAQHNQFDEELVAMVQGGLIGNVLVVTERSVRKRLLPDFRILHDSGYKKSNRNPNGVVTGRYSGNDWEVASASSV